MFAGYLCPKCSANGLKSCEVKTTNWQEQKTIAELQKRIDELEKRNNILEVIAAHNQLYIRSQNPEGAAMEDDIPY